MSKKILVVDDKSFMVRLIQHHLERAGYELIKARNRQEAMSALEHESPELMVMDDSPEEIGQFHSNHATRSIPTIRVTDIPQIDSNNRSNDANVVFTKPFSPTHFLAEVRRLVPESKTT